MIAVPALVFYAMGYRFDFSDEDRNIRSVGGMYISADANETEIFIDDEPVEDMRIFQRAAYIQNLTEGVHQVHVQGLGLQTWVKELPVFSHYVTEAASFNMPTIPQVRLISEYETLQGETVLFSPATSTPLTRASSSQFFFVATSTATSTFVIKSEYEYVETLFASSTEMQNARAQQFEIIAQPFQFSQDVQNATTALATTTKMDRDTRLYEEDGEVYISWTGDRDAIPYYYCVRYDTASTTAALYGTHVENSVVAQVFNAYQENDQVITSTQMRDQRWCRDAIKIDRQQQELVWFDYFPNSQDLVLMHMAEGLFVVEVDDRAWQNTQLLYPGETIQVVKDGDRIFVYDEGYYFEVFTQLQE